MSMTGAVRARIVARAGDRCEYCLLPQATAELPILPRFHIEHIIPKKHGGTDNENNLALACHYCNFHKGTNLSGLDPNTKKLTPLFNPRQHIWQQQFVVHLLEINGRTDIGRTTSQVLQMNSLDRLRLRAHLKRIGLKSV